MRPRTYRRLAVFLALWIPACGWKVTPPLRPERPAPSARVAQGVVLKVNDGGVAWGGGRLGEVVRDTLVATGAFEQVYFPVEPRNPPPLRLVIDATGRVQEEIGLGIVKSVIIGALLFAPVGLIRFTKSFDLDAQVVLLRDGEELRRFRVTTSTGVSHTMFSQIEQYEAAARTAAFKDLGERIAAELAGLRIS